MNQLNVKANCQTYVMGIFSKIAKSVSDVIQQSESPNQYSYGEFVVIDVETTGLNPKIDRIVEIALLRVSNGNVIESYDQRFNPEGPVGKTEIHGITDADVANAPLFKDKVEDIQSFIQQRALVAHNAKFDLAFLRAEFARAGVKLPWLESLCTLEASQYYLPSLSRRKLADCCEEIGISIENAHSALGDAMATAKLCHYYLMPEKKPSPRASDLNLILNPKEVFYPEVNPLPSHVRNQIQKQKDTSGAIASTALSQLRKLLNGVGMNSMLGEEFHTGSVEYLEKLMEFLEDSSLSQDEEKSLDALREIYNLESGHVQELHEHLLKLVIEQAFEDEKISNSEREEFKLLAVTLRIQDSKIISLTKSAKNMRYEKLSRNLEALPESWKLGDPLRVGQSVVFTGCEPTQRERLENNAKKAGVTVATGVSKKTAFLITDGSYSGNKASDALELGTRIVSPDDFEVLIKFIQPYAE